MNVLNNLDDCHLGTVSFILKTDSHSTRDQRFCAIGYLNQADD